MGGPDGQTDRQADRQEFAKAFDKVPQRILHILYHYGIRGSTQQLINSWFSGRTQQVVLDD